MPAKLQTRSDQFEIPFHLHFSTVCLKKQSTFPLQTALETTKDHNEPASQCPKRDTKGQGGHFFLAFFWGGGGNSTTSQKRKHLGTKLRDCHSLLPTLLMSTTIFPGWAPGLLSGLPPPLPALLNFLSHLSQGTFVQKATDVLSVSDLAAGLKANALSQTLTGALPRLKRAELTLAKCKTSERAPSKFGPSPRPARERPANPVAFTSGGPRGG